MMSSEALLSNVIPFAGSGLRGYAMGFALKKVLKWMTTGSRDCLLCGLECYPCRAIKRPATLN
jgi:hypothetical protein